MSERSKRWGAKQKTELILRLLRGESVDVLSREESVPMSTITEWRDQFLEAGTSGFKRMSHRDVKLAESQRLIGKLQMELELYKKKTKFGKLIRKDSFDL
ncbi:hypothetical protein KKA47_06230 [bacterium]|nr:hypothetical protein [bacterium]